ncbi:unnamed protein product [Protopolystoma xenopodis]|uniref:Uncharacterized protein n=1 Tax=Protopolystoma xenopodis TaxID=117903 RepID=A0A448XEK5_9PLAT|nr:unnamed protein product [Protopolystoma xenopodis]
MKRHAYIGSFRLKVIKFAKEFGNHAAEREFGPPPDRRTTIRWRKEEENLRKMPRMKKASFKKCGISNSLDGSEDHLIYEDGDEDDTEEKELLAKFDASDIEEDEEREGVVTIPDVPDSDDECMSDYYGS